MSKKEEKSGDKPTKINDGKCCRCIFRKMKICTSKKSEKSGKYVARKGTCKYFKYDA